MDDLAFETVYCLTRPVLRTQTALQGKHPSVAKGELEVSEHFLGRRAEVPQRSQPVGRTVDEVVGTLQRRGAT